MFGNGKVFVSHTHEDNAACAPVLAALDAWQVDYWFDLGQLSAGLELLETIERAQEGRDIFLRICTPAALASPWMAQERKLARSLRAPSGKRRMIDLIVKPGYVISAEEAHVLVIDATQQPEVEWLRQLREALGIPSRERRVSRRAALGVGITSLAALGGMGFASKLLFFTPPSPNLYLPIGHQPTATALPGSSRIRWTFSLYPQPFGSATSVFQAGQTLICSDASTLTALNSADGKFLWIQRQYSINQDVPPTVVGDAIYVTYDDTTYASENASGVHNIYLAVFNVTDGSERWHQLIIADPGEKTDTSAVTVAGNTAYVRYNQTLYACDAKTGKTLWSQGAGETGAKLGEILPAPIAAGDNVFAILGDRKLHAFAAASGAPLWPAPFASTMPIRTRPVVANGVVYVGADGGWCYALDATTGVIRWKTDLLQKTATPLAADDRARFTSLGLTLSENVLYISGGWPVDDVRPSDVRHEGVIQALDPTTGKILWQSAPREQIGLTGSLILLDSLFRAEPVVAGDRIFMATKMRTTDYRDINVLFALNKLDGKVKWNFQMWGYLSSFSDYDGVPSAPMVSGDTLYIISGNEMLYAISHAD